jgi:hypothetical protein
MLVFHYSHCLVIYSVSPYKLLGTKSYGTWFSLNSNSNPLSSVFKPSQMELVWKPQTSPYNHANINSQSRRSRQIGILGNFSGFSKQVWTPNKFRSNLKVVLFLGFLIQILFQNWTCFKSRVVPYLSFYQHAKFGKLWSTRRVIFIIYKVGSVWKNRKSILNGLGHE